MIIYIYVTSILIIQILVPKQLYQKTMQMALSGGRDFFNPCERPLPLHLKVLLLGDPTIWAHQSIPWQWLPASLPHPEASAWCGSTGYRDQDGIIL